MPIWVPRASHIFSRQSAADHSVIVVFNSSSAKVRIIEASSITGLTKKISFNWHFRGKILKTDAYAALSRKWGNRREGDIDQRHMQTWAAIWVAYHPNIRLCFQLWVHVITAKDWVHFKPSSTCKLNIRFQTYRYNYMICFDLWFYSKRRKKSI